MENEDLIVKAILNGNKDAFKIVVDEYKNYVFAICVNMLRNPQDAENVSQEIFISVYRSLSSYGFKGLKSWIGKIAVNRSIDYKRKLSRQKDNEVIYLDDIKNVQSNRMGVEEEIIKKDENKRIRVLCSELPEKYSIVVNKYYMQSKSYKEIASEENISIKTVETRLYRAKKILREKYMEGGG